jgi:predicted metal-dependent HD superfamily phosphohydrolase
MSATFTLAQRLCQRFEVLTMSFDTSAHISQSWGNTLVGRYSEPHRHYHTISHVGAMIACLDAQQVNIKDSAAVELAIFFHDWIYEPQSGSNETESVLAFQDYATEIRLDKDLRDKVVRLVEATVKHGVLEHIPYDERGDMELFLDFDMEVLSREWEEYTIYADQIRKEYSCFTDQEYGSGRTKVLQSFLQKKRIYFSDSFHVDKEESARRNLTREIAVLKQKGL